MELKKVTKENIRDFLANQYDAGLSKKTIARRLASIKSFSKFLFNTDFITKNPTIFLSTPKVAKKLPSFIDEKIIFQSKIGRIRDIEIQESTGKIFLLTDSGSIWRLYK